MVSWEHGMPYPTEGSSTLRIAGTKSLVTTLYSSRNTCALRDLPLPALPGAPPRGVAPHRVAGNAAVVAELARDLHRAVDRLLGLTALRVT